MSDQVNHPAHYCKGRTIEPADAIIDWGLSWCLGNVVKYIARAGRKTDLIEDLKKAAWYLQKEISRLEIDTETSERDGVTSTSK